MGSGHILVYAFDVLMDIYTSCGWSERDAALSILQHNLYGLDIDRRAYQLAYFAVMMKARQYNRSIIKSGEVQPNLANFADVMGIDTQLLSGKIEQFAEQFTYADTYGSLMEVTAPEGLDEAVSQYSGSFGLSLAQLDMMMMIYKILSQKYDVVCTNPPYMGGSGMNAKLSEFVKKNFPDSKSDLFACFIEKCGQLIKPNGFYAMITQHAWMFLSSYENLRKKLMLKTTVDMAHLGARAFDEIGGEVVQTTAFVMTGHIDDYKGTYARLVDIVGENEKCDLFLSGEKRYAAKQENFSKIPGMPVAYWVSENFVRAFENGVMLTNIAPTRKGMFTGNNDLWLKYWFEISHDKLFYQFKPYNKGGEYRKWYGNHEYVVNWGESGAEIKSFKGSGNINDSMYFRKCVTWSLITSAKQSFRAITDTVHVLGDAGPVALTNDENMYYILGVLNSNYIEIVISILAPTLNCSNGVVGGFPIIVDDEKKSIIDEFVKGNIEMSKSDWDSFEISWDFEGHPLI